MKRELLYPFFIECSCMTEDKYWKEIFTDLAYGVAPYGAYVSKGFIVCNYKEKEFMYKITQKEPSALYNDIYNLFTTKLNIISSVELANKKKTLEKFYEEIEDWNSIKRKNLKDVLIENWAINMKNTYGLTMKQTRSLVSMIFLCIIFKLITSKDIIIENGVIASITGISFEQGKVNMEKDLYDIRSTISPDIISNKLNMSDEWEKYLKNLKTYEN